jgi:quinol monooxygenase YgiN
MNTRQLFFLGASIVASALGGVATAQKTREQHVHIAGIEIDAAQLEDCKAAVREHTETAIRVEPGVPVLYAVSPARVFEIYASTEAYSAHLEAAHFKKMVKSLKPVQTVPVMLGAKAR